MPPIGKRSDVTGRAITRLGSIESDSFAPSLDAKEDSLEAAISWYDGLRPRVAIYEVAGNDVKRRFVLSTDLADAGWKKGTSKAGPLELVTSPNTDDEYASEIPISEWSQRQSTAGDDVVYLAAAVPTGTTLRVHWNAPHLVDKDSAAVTTIPEGDAEAFVAMLAALLARWISRKASDITNSSIGADQIDAEPIGERWARRARELEKYAMERLSPTPESVSSAGASIEWKGQGSSLTSQPRIGH